MRLVCPKMRDGPFIRRTHLHSHYPWYSVCWPLVNWKRMIPQGTPPTTGVNKSLNTLMGLMAVNDRIRRSCFFLLFLFLLLLLLLLLLRLLRLLRRFLLFFPDEHFQLERVVSSMVCSASHSASTCRLNLVLHACDFRSSLLGHAASVEINRIRRKKVFSRLAY